MKYQLWVLCMPVCVHGKGRGRGCVHCMTINCTRYVLPLTSQDYHSFDFGQVEVTSLHILTRGVYDQDGGYKVLKQFHL